MANIYNEYTYNSLVKEAMGRKRHSNVAYESSRDGSEDFTKTKSFEEACDFAIKGWDLGLKEYKIEDGLIIGGSTDLLPSVAGCIPHVQNHILGFPQDMYALHDTREYNLPTLDLVFNLCYTAGIEGYEALNYSKSIVAFINAKASTHNIRLTGVFASKQGSKRVFDFITLKDFDSALVLNNIAFAFHPSFFRRIWFSILEGKEYWSSGYGRTIDNYQKEVLEHTKGSKADETIIFKTLNDIPNDCFEWDINKLNRITLKM